MSQKEVASALGCSNTVYSRYETGKREPSLDTLCYLADVFGVSTDYLLGREPVEKATLSEYEKSLVFASRKLPDYVREDMLDYMQVRGSRDE